MKRVIFLLCIVFGLSGCFLFKSNLRDSDSKYESPQQLMDNAFTVPFTEYDYSKVNAILSSVKAGKIKRIKVVYYNNKMLADMIKESFKKSDNVKVFVEHLDGSNESLSSYVGNRVLVSLYRN